MSGQRWEINIILENGQLMVSAPCHERVLCYGMLEMAKDLVKQQGDQMQNGAKIIAAGADLVAAVRR